MRMQTFEAVLARPETVQQVRVQQRAIERIGGEVEISPPSPAGLLLVRLTLPEPYTPNDFLPALPFFPA